MRFILLLLLFYNGRLTYQTFSEPFYNYLINSYGIQAARVIARPDFGSGGSFGGTNNTNIIIHKRPVIIVHGVTNTAGKFNFVRNFLLMNNYTNDEIYGTTYGEGPKRFIVFVHIECQFIRQIRVLISAVSKYTRSKVDVLAYSMGSPVARKAMLGGTCEESELGDPLTDLVESFVSVAGANFGSFLCFVPIGICNDRNGLHCDSEFLHELNAQPIKYEGRRTYSIYTTTDNKVGHDCCGTNCSFLPHADEEFVYNKWDHDQIMTGTLKLQLELINRK